MVPACPAHKGGRVQYCPELPAVVCFLVTIWLISPASLLSSSRPQSYMLLFYERNGIDHVSHCTPGTTYMYEIHCYFIGLTIKISRCLLTVPVVELPMGLSWARRDAGSHPRALADGGVRCGKCRVECPSTDVNLSEFAIAGKMDLHPSSVTIKVKLWKPLTVSQTSEGCSDDGSCTRRTGR